MTEPTKPYCIEVLRRAAAEGNYILSSHDRSYDDITQAVREALELLESLQREVDELRAQSSATPAVNMDRPWSIYD